MDNQVADVSVVPGLSKPKVINLRGNTYLDITPLTALMGLQRLVLPELYNTCCADIEYIQTFGHVRKSTAIGRVYCQGRMTRELAGRLDKDRPNGPRRRCRCLSAASMRVRSGRNWTALKNRDHLTWHNRKNGEYEKFDYCWGLLLFVALPLVVMKYGDNAKEEYVQAAISYRGCP